MKPCKLLSFLFAAALAFFFARAASAQTNAYDDAFHYSYNSASGFTNAFSGGFGFGPWVRATNGPNSHGFFTTHNTSTTPFPSIASPTNYSSTNVPPVGSPPGNDNSQHVWGVFANGTSGPNAAAQFRAFSNSLDTTVAFKIDWQSDGIGPANTNMGGFSLRNGMVTTSPSDFQTGLRFMFYYVGAAASNSFQIFDANGANPIGIPFTSAGLACEFTLEAGDTYRFVVKNATNGVILASVDNQPLAGSGTIDSVALFAQETSGGNQEFNFMQIVSTSLTPPTFANVLPATGSLYLSTAANNVSFEVDSLASTVASNGVKLLLNGVVQSNLLFNTTSPTNQLLVTNNTALAPDTFYTYTIIAQDANGNLATNTANFNTFLASDLYIDAADYNFGAGQFIDSEPQDLYANLLGTNGVDYFEADLSGTNNVYRPGDLPQVLTLATDVTGDPIDHGNERANNSTVFNIGFTDNGDWDNYTRSVTVATNYSIYARAASLTGGQFEIEKLVNPLATNTSQPLIPLGRVNVQNTGGSRTYTGQLTPVVDAFGNTVVVPLSGTSTFRQTAIASKVYNLEYFVLVPIANSTNTLRPYLSTANPAPAATGVTLDNPILLSIANRQTGANPASVQISLNGTNITGLGALATNALGCTFSYSPPNFLPPNTTNTVQVVFADSASVSSTNTWQFVTLNIVNTLISTSFAQPFNSGTTNGFGLTMFKIPDAAPVVGTLSNAWNELAGLIIDTNSNAPYINLATNPVTGSDFSLDTNVIAFDITGAVTASFTFTNRSPFPYIPVTNLANNFVMQALTYLQLTNGAYHLAVRSDDGFELTTGPTPANTNTVLGLFDLGRANTTPTDIYFTIQTNGLYPMSLFYVQESSGGNIEFYSFKNGKAILVNDPANANAIKAFASISTSSPATPVNILGAAYSAGTASFHFTTQSGHTHFVEFKANLTDPTWSPLQTVTGTGSSTNITDSTGGTTRFYRVRTQ